MDFGGRKRETIFIFTLDFIIHLTITSLTKVWVHPYVGVGVVGAFVVGAFVVGAFVVGAFVVGGKVGATGFGFKVIARPKIVIIFIIIFRFTMSLVPKHQHHHKNFLINYLLKLSKLQYKLIIKLLILINLSYISSTYFIFKTLIFQNIFIY